MSYAVRNIQRADGAVIAQLAAAGTATVHEAQGRSGLLQPYMRPIYAGAAIGGSAVTVLAHPGDNWMLHAAIELCQPGDVMVVACSAPNTDGMFGELLATSMRARGIAGLVIDAGCRDVQALKDMQFPVWSKAISAKGTIKATPGSVNLPVVCAGAMVSAGDVVVADDDGIVVVPRRRAAEVAHACEARLQKEAMNRKRLAAGELGLDIYGMRDKLREAGLVYVDSEADLP
ncbi:4-carboxy-4-hydroxy-2-oxoadipate aldolase/oxaloacetate decarboxylase [Bordetella genomosp. 11]|uniref:4-hydroxy-4-methyl-2-oxoglutarate aldolase n=1 Tax=Bordetella genomosp. 11 TaxID=1416808 RepID=A0A261UHN2_9BORD|nr:4-carboxy-4-hydroxy-2-oxoadipate aldolase/oxaloacetate decarboxylase [Bordetella genomosp. 11]OZI60393.1 4-carboxy-4-hydroxy-2-oxoadipate aldolase/oxaloacetate decarboxylase [Bordetella genomosp. 11]